MINPNRFRNEDATGRTFVNLDNVLVVFPHWYQRYYTIGGKFYQNLNDKNHEISNSIIRELFVQLQQNREVDELYDSEVLVYLFDFDCWMSLDDWLSDNYGVSVRDVIFEKNDGKVNFRVNYDYYSSIDDMILTLCKYHSADVMPAGVLFPVGNDRFESSPWFTKCKQRRKH